MCMSLNNFLTFMYSHILNAIGILFMTIYIHQYNILRASKFLHEELAACLKIPLFKFIPLNSSIIDQPIK